MPPNPLITTVAELEQYGLSRDALSILERMKVVYLDDLTKVTAKDIQAYEGGGPVTIRNIKTTLRNYLAGRIVRTTEDMCFPKHWPKKTRKKK